MHKSDAKRMLLSAVLLGLCLSPAIRADDPDAAPGEQGPQLLWAGPADQAEPAAAEPATRPDEPQANPLPGITIDRHRRRVMLQCRSLQPGVPLELIAVMRNSREHEAIMVVRARPQHVHLALLVCGYEPGRPAMWDEERQAAVAPSGDPVSLLVQWVDPKTKQERTVAIEDWLASTDPAKPVPRLHWLFTGSQRFENGQYLADLEGSVISLANFADAVLDLPGIQTRDNEALEFKGNEQVMPPAGTPCTLILLPPAKMRVNMDRFGKVQIHGRAIPPGRLSQMLSAHNRSRDDARIELQIDADALAADVQNLLAECEKAGFPAERIDRLQPATQPDGSAAFPANDPQAAWDLLAEHLDYQRQALARSLESQQQWLTQLDRRRTLLARQYDELTGYLDKAARQYRQAISLWARE